MLDFARRTRFFDERVRTLVLWKYNSNDTCPSQVSGLHSQSTTVAVPDLRFKCDGTGRGDERDAQPRPFGTESRSMLYLDLTNDDELGLIGRNWL